MHGERDTTVSTILLWSHFVGHNVRGSFYRKFSIMGSILFLMMDAVNDRSNKQAIKSFSVRPKDNFESPKLRLSLSVSIRVVDVSI